MRSLVIVCLLGCSASPAPSPPKPVAITAPPEVACTVDDDCVSPDLSKEITNPDDCECKACGFAPVNRATFGRRRDAWSKHCTMVDQYVLNNRKVCPYTDCLYVDIGCREGRCVELPSRFGRPVTLPYAR